MTALSSITALALTRGSTISSSAAIRSRLLALKRDGTRVQLSAEAGELRVLVERVSKHGLPVAAPAAVGTGRELVAVMRVEPDGAEWGASVMLGSVEEDA